MVSSGGWAIARGKDLQIPRDHLLMNLDYSGHHIYPLHYGSTSRRSWLRWSRASGHLLPVYILPPSPNLGPRIRIHRAWSGLGVYFQYSETFGHISLGLMQTRSFDEMAARLSTGDASLLAELHAITSGLKVTITSVGILDIETARRSMGGHGYSAFSGLGSIYADYVPSAT